jgi:hypothetical protein
MLAAIHRVLGLVQTQPTGEKPMTAVLAMEWGDKEQRSHVFARRLRMRSEHAPVLTVRTRELPAHWTSSDETGLSVNAQESYDRL